MQILGFVDVQAEMGYNNIKGIEGNNFLNLYAK